MNIKKLILSITSSSMLVFCISPYVQAKDTTSTNEKITIGEKGGYLAGNFSSTKKIYEQRRFTWYEGGKGYVAEQANNLSDRLHGKNAKIVGGNNTLNGADRVILNRNGKTVLIQDKCYEKASKNIRDAFDQTTKKYRYIGADGKPMILEVPKGQGKECIQVMEKKIKAGLVDGITDPNEAKNIVQEGAYTFEQAKQIAKFGNVESLKYDAKNGAIIALGSMGLSFTLDFATSMIGGNDWQTSLDAASKSALKTGVGVETIYILASQLGKAKAGSIFKPATDSISKLLGNNKVSNSIVTHFGEYQQACTANAVSNILQQQLLVNLVALAVFTTPDVIDLFSGRISSEQLMLNLAILIGGSAGATIGSIAGSTIGGPVGVILGGMSGGYVGSYTSKTLLTTVFKEDADEMFDIITKRYSKVSRNYLVSKEEANEITDSLSKQLTTDTLKDMYESKNREAFADKLIKNEFKNQINKRKKIIVPTQEQVRKKYKDDLGNGIYIW